MAVDASQCVLTTLTIAMQSTTIELAQQGNDSAIAEVMNQALEPLGVSVDAGLNDGCLSLTLVSSQALDQAKLMSIVRIELAALRVESITRVKVSGWRKDEELPEQLPSWHQEFTLEPIMKASSKHRFSESKTFKLPALDQAPDEARDKPINKPPVTSKSQNHPSVQAQLSASKKNSLPVQVFFAAALVIFLGLGLGIGVRLITSSAGTSARDTGTDVTATKITTAQESGGTPVTPQETPRPEDVKITLEKFNQIQKGMTLKQVEEAIGTSGKLIANSKVGDVVGQVYSWKNSQGSNAIIEFRNGEVAAKAQAGL